MTTEQILRADLCRRIRQARKARGLTQEDLAEQTALSRNTIRLIELGHDVYLSTYLKVAAALEIVFPLED